MRKLALTLLIVILVAGGIVLTTAILTGDQKLPVGKPGPGAEALADRIEKSVHLDGWQKIAALDFSFVPSGTRHFVDLKRHLAEVSYDGRKGKITVRYRTDGSSDGNGGAFVAYQDGKRLSGDEAADALKQAKIFHDQDLFWLNPFAFLRSPGTQRSLVGERALLFSIHNGSGGTKNSYLIVTDAEGKPTHWKLWVDYARLKGVEVSFDGWQKLSSGALVSLKRESILRDLDLDLRAAYDSYPQPGSPDRFSDLLEQSSPKESGKSP